MFGRPSPKQGVFPRNSGKICPIVLPLKCPLEISISRDLHQCQDLDTLCSTLSVQKTKRLKGAKWDPAEMSSGVYCCCCRSKLNQWNAAFCNSQTKPPPLQLRHSTTCRLATRLLTSQTVKRRGVRQRQPLARDSSPKA